MLQQLKEFAERDKVPLPPRYNLAQVHYMIRLNEDGTPRDPQPVPLGEGKQRWELRAVPRVVRSSGIRPLLLADNAEYTLGLPRQDAKPAGVEKRHRAYLDLLAALVADTGDPAAAAVLHFLREGGRGGARAAGRLRPGGRPRL